MIVSNKFLPFILHLLTISTFFRFSESFALGHRTGARAAARAKSKERSPSGREVEVYFIRHGQSLFNVDFHKYGEKWIQDNYTLLKDAPLTENGIHQAKTVVHKTLTKYLGDTENEKIGWISSPLTRAVETVVYGMPDSVKDVELHLWPVFREVRIQSSPDGHGMPWVNPSAGDDGVCPADVTPLVVPGEGVTEISPEQEKLLNTDLRTRLCSAFVGEFEMKNVTKKNDSDSNKKPLFPVSKFEFGSPRNSPDVSKMWWLPHGHDENDKHFSESPTLLHGRGDSFIKQFFDFLMQDQNKHLEKIVIGGHSLFWRDFFLRVLTGAIELGGEEPDFLEEEVSFLEADVSILEVEEPNTSKEKSVGKGKDVNQHDFDCLITEHHSMANGGVIGMKVVIEEQENPHKKGEKILKPRFASLEKMNFHFDGKCNPPEQIVLEDDNDKDKGNKGMSMGCVFGIIVCIIVGLGAMVFIFMMIFKKGGNDGGESSRSE